VREREVKKLKQCAACRYCRVHAFIKASALLVIGSIVTIILTFNSGGI
jgi:hypothetical protein